MNLDFVSPEAVREALRAVRFGRSLRESPLLHMRALSQRMRAEGVSDTPHAREWWLGHLLDELSRTRLESARAPESWAPAARAHELEDDLRRLASDFSHGRIDLEALSALRFRYFAPTSRMMQDVAEELGIVYRTLARRLNRGHELLADSLRERELEALREVRPEDDPTNAIGDTATSREPNGAGRAARGLPTSSTAFVGRREARASLETLIESTRLVTLTGPGGIGKTRLAVELARAVAAAHRDGVDFVAMADVTDGILVPARLADALGVREEAGATLTDSIAVKLVDSARLLVLDNCEHLIEACARLVAALLAACPDLRVLATSREPLRIAGEHVWPVPPLTVGRGDDVGAADEAVALFVARAREVRPEFALTDDIRPTVARICRRLDGLPLAIELAAVRISVLSPDEIASRLDDRFRLLTRGARSAALRHRTLRAAIDWGHSLLDPDERRLLRRLAVFQGWTLEAAEAVVTDGSLEDWALLDLLSQLIDKSFVTASWNGGSRRFGLLESLHAYTWERLEESGEAPALEARHLAWAAALAEEAEPALRGPEQERWLRRLDQERSNLRAALERSAARAELIPTGLRLAAALGSYWMTRGMLTEGREHLSRLLASEAGGESLELRARALAAAGALARQQSDYPAAERLLEDSLKIYRDLSAVLGMAETLRSLGNVADDRGAYELAAARYEESLLLYRQAGNRWGEAAVQNNRGISAYHRGDFAAARPALEASLTGFRGLGERWAEGVTLLNLAKLSLDEDDSSAEELFRESLTIAHALDDPAGVTAALAGLGHVALKRGDTESARARFLERLPPLRALDDRQDIAEWLEAMADVDRLVGRADRAVELYAAAEALREVIGAPRPPKEREAHTANLLALRDALGEVRYRDAWARGNASSADQAITQAVADG